MPMAYIHGNRAMPATVRDNPNHSHNLDQHPSHHGHDPGHHGHDPNIRIMNTKAGQLR